jgi:integrase
VVVFAAAIGLRPSELFGLEWRDIDRDAGVVYVRRAYANRRLKHTKTRLSISLLDALVLKRAVDAAWTSPRTPAEAVRESVSTSRARRSRRTVDAPRTPRVISVASPDQQELREAL